MRKERIHFRLATYYGHISFFDFQHLTTTTLAQFAAMSISKSAHEQDTTESAIMSSLLDKLSAELRLQIYENVLHFDCPIRPVGSTDGRTALEADQKLKRANTSILLACKAIYSEALPTF